MSIGERETLRSPDLTIEWIRDVEGVGKRGGPLHKLTRAPYSTPDVNKYYIMDNR